MDWEIDSRGEGEVTFLARASPGSTARLAGVFKQHFPLFYFLFLLFFFFQEGGSAELEQEKQTFFLHLIRQLHQPQAPHLPGFHSDYTKHTMTSAGMTSAL